ncbi:MAG: alpha/beta hydrolase [Armatimonadaceae bacterium]
MAAAVGASVPLALALFFLHPPRRLHPRNPHSALGIPYERVRFRASDGVTLRGWYVPAPENGKVAGQGARGVIVISHGYYGNRSEMLPYLAFLHHAGYAALLYDFRAHGWSNGRRATFGLGETRDLQAAIHWVREHPDLRDLPLFLLGESMGASVSLMAAAEEERVRAVVADSPYARFDRAVEGRLRTALGEPVAKVVTPPTRRVGEWILGVPSDKIAPIEAAAKIAPRPILLIHGQEDRFIVPDNSRDIQQVCTGNAYLWEVPNARHVRSVYVAGDEYPKRVLSFLEAAGE